MKHRENHRLMALNVQQVVVYAERRAHLMMAVQPDRTM